MLHMTIEFPRSMGAQMSLLLSGLPKGGEFADSLQGIYCTFVYPEGWLLGCHLSLPEQQAGAVYSAEGERSRSSEDSSLQHRNCL